MEQDFFFRLDSKVPCVELREDYFPLPAFIPPHVGPYPAAPPFPCFGLEALMGLVGDL